VSAGEFFDDFALNRVGVLVFVDEDELELELVLGEDSGVGGEEVERAGEEVVEVCGVGVSFTLIVLVGDFADAFGDITIAPFVWCAGPGYGSVAPPYMVSIK
jgi:hypothetical protein